MRRCLFNQSQGMAVAGTAVAIALAAAVLVVAALAVSLALKRDSVSGPQEDLLVMLDSTGTSELGIVTAEVDFDIGDDPIEVPSSAVVELDGDPHVFVKDFGIPNAFVRVPVETREDVGDSTTILKGLFPGDDLVVVGADLLGSERATSLSGAALADYLDSPTHVTEHPQQSGLQIWLERVRKLTAFSGGRLNNSYSHAQ